MIIANARNIARWLRGRSETSGEGIEVILDFLMGMDLTLDDVGVNPVE